MDRSEDDPGRAGASSLDRTRHRFSKKTVYVIVVLVALAILVLVIAAVLVTRHGTSPDTPSAYPPSAVRYFRNGAAATDALPCSTIAAEVLADGGGSVTDAGVAAAICLGVVQHHNAGLGGGHFAVILDKPRLNDTLELMSVDARETAPLSITRQMLDNVTSMNTGSLAVGVPGEVAGLHAAWLRYGRRPWPALLRPSIALCRSGVPVTRALAAALVEYSDRVRSEPQLRELFEKPDGTLVVEGDLVTNSLLADTLQRVADDPLSFYNGSLAADLVEDLRERGGAVTLADLAAYRPVVERPLSFPLRSGRYTMYSMEAPGSGPVLMFMFNILQGYKLSPADFEDPERRVLTYHRIAEAFKFAYSRRAQLGDRNFVEHVKDLQVNMTSWPFGDYIRRLIDDENTFPAEHYGPVYDMVEDSGTTHLSIMSREGAAIAITLTINSYFGSYIRGRSTGVLFNNEMADFSHPAASRPTPANYPAPGKRPMSSMCPVLVLDDRRRAVYASGASGSMRITTGVAFVLLHSLVLDQDTVSAHDMARIHHQLHPTPLQYEHHLPQIIVRGLQQKGHETRARDYVGIVQSVKNECVDSSDTSKCLTAISDGRKGGTPDGY